MVPPSGGGGNRVRGACVQLSAVVVCAWKGRPRSQRAGLFFGERDVVRTLVEVVAFGFCFVFCIVTVRRVGIVCVTVFGCVCGSEQSARSVVASFQSKRGNVKRQSRMSAFAPAMATSACSQPL